MCEQQNRNEQRWFYQQEQEWIAFCERLKLTPCPHCHQVGSLNRMVLFWDSMIVVRSERHFGLAESIAATAICVVDVDVRSVSG